MRYDYRAAVTADILEYIEYNVDLADFGDIDELEEHLNEVLWREDSVTGGASGSYTFSSAQAREYVLENMDELQAAACELGIDASEIGKQLLSNEWEWADITIRCYLLSECIELALEQVASPF